VSHRKTIFLIIALLCLRVACFADLAPEPGHKRVYLSLLLQTREDLSDYRFFIESGMQLEEVKLSPETPVTVSPKGGGARYNSATVYAVPKKAVTFKGASPSTEELADLAGALGAKRVTGAVKLLDHSFSFDVPEAEADSYTNPVYQLRRDAQFGVVAERLDDGTPASAHKPPNPASDKSDSQADRGFTIVVACILVFSAVLGGLWLLRRRAS